ncbi:MAG TPA: ATP-binding cassette domain-containing protein [Anaerolineae bacterium]|nr:ATP-binding cassette domain-containing protein [Anaerolineae bacterium]
MSDRDDIIVIQDLTFTYAATETPALRNINLKIQRGEYVALLGINGAGKTTLELCLNGIIPNMIMGEMQGSVVVDGKDTNLHPVRELAKTIGIIFDNPEFQLSQITVAEEIALGLENLGVPYDDMNRIIHEMLELVDLQGLEERSPLMLSGGQQQRLAIASAMAMQPAIIVMDEPTSNLDPIGKQEVFEIARKLNRERGMTVIIAEHEVEVMAQYADRVIVLDHGQILLNGTPSQVFSQVEHLQEIGLRPPQATELAYRLKNEYAAWNSPLPVTTDQAVASLEQQLNGVQDAVPSHR